MRAKLEDAIQAAADAGFEAVELWADSLDRYLASHSIEDLQALLSEHRMSVVSIGDIESVTFCNPQQLRELRDRCKQLVSIARAIECPALVVSASVKPAGAGPSEIMNETVSALGKLLDVVEPEGVGLALAFRGFGWCAVNSLEQAREAVKCYSGRRIGLALDTFDLHITGADPETLTSLDPSEIFVMRLGDCGNIPKPIIADSDRVLPREGVAELDAMIDALARTGYSGPVSLKILAPRLWSLDSAEIAKAAMTVAMEYLRVAGSDKKR